MAGHRTFLTLCSAAALLAAVSGCASRELNLERETAIDIEANSLVDRLRLVKGRTGKTPAEHIFEVATLCFETPSEGAVIVTAEETPAESSYTFRLFVGRDLTPDDEDENHEVVYQFRFTSGRSSTIYAEAGDPSDPIAPRGQRLARRYVAYLKNLGRNGDFLTFPDGCPV